MKQVGITRRIDELGRVVIPKELRKNMHIKSGELLEIYLKDEESLILKKHSSMSKQDEFVNIFLKSLSRIINGNIYITNLNEIVFSSNDIALGQKLNSDFEEIITNNMTNISINNIKLTTKITLSASIKIYPIIPNGDLVGVMVIESENLMLNEELIKFSISVIESYFENN